MSQHTSLFYNRFAVLYPVVDWFLSKQKKVLFQEIDALPEGSLLEIGVGNGSHFGLYKKHQVTGIDTSAAMLKKARSRNYPQIELLEMDATALLFQDEQFDYVVISHVIAVVNNPDKLLQEVQRVLKPQGKVLILNHFTPNNWLKFIDKAFALVSKAFHFRSVFYIEDINSIKKFKLLKQIHLGLSSYFKLLIYQKV